MTAPTLRAVVMVYDDAWGTVKQLLDASSLRVTAAAGGPHQIPRYVVSTTTYERLPRTSSEISDRELEVLRLIALGHENPQIAKILFLAPNTVRSHVKNLLRKLGARARAQAVAIGYQRGLLGGDS